MREETAPAKAHQWRKDKLLSFVTSLYRSAPYLDELHRRCAAIAEKLGLSCEFVMVNDGSPDNSLEVALALADRDSRVTVIDLSRNFGHHPAMMVGMEHAQGDLIFAFDSDLEEPPEHLEVMLARMEQGLDDPEGPIDVVYGIREDRKDPCFRRMASQGFYKLARWLIKTEGQDNVLFMRLMTSRYVEALTRYPERHLFLGALFPYVGFRQEPMILAKTYKGTTSYSMLARIRLAVDGMISFSARPLIMIGLLGLFIAVVAGVFALKILIQAIFTEQVVEGWASLIVSIWLLGGLTLFSIGSVGIYVARMFEEVKARPRVVIKEIHNFKGDDNSPTKHRG